MPEKRASKKGAKRSGRTHKTSKIGNLFTGWRTQGSARITNTTNVSTGICMRANDDDVDTARRRGCDGGRSWKWKRRAERKGDGIFWRSTMQWKIFVDSLFTYSSGNWNPFVYLLPAKIYPKSKQMWAAFSLQQKSATIYIYMWAEVKATTEKNWEKIDTFFFEHFNIACLPACRDAAS